MAVSLRGYVSMIVSGFGGTVTLCRLMVFRLGYRLSPLVGLRGFAGSVAGRPCVGKGLDGRILVACSLVCSGAP